MADSPVLNGRRKKLLALGLGLSIACGSLIWVENQAREDELGNMILVFEPPGRKYALPPSEDFKDRGWREGLEPPPKPPGQTRILCLGDSLTYGVQVSPRQAWPALLNSWLRAQTGKAAVEVRNFGLNGWDAEQVASLTISGMDEWQPDLVIWGSFGNDLEPTRLLYGREGGDPVYVGSEIPEEIRILPESWGLKLRKHSALYRRWLGARYSRWAKEQPRSAQDDPDFYSRHLAQLQEWAQSREVPLLVVAIPAHVLSDPEACPESFGGDEGPCEVAHSRHAQILDQLQISEVDHLDLLPTFQSSGRPHFHPEDRPDPDHPGVAGHQLIATTLLPWIQGQLGLEVVLPEAPGG